MCNTPYTDVTLTPEITPHAVREWANTTRYDTHSAVILTHNTVMLDMTVQPVRDDTACSKRIG